MKHRYIYTAHKPFPDHLTKVKAEMQVLGAPTIKVVDTGDYYIALEGVHRLNAAKELGLTPILDILDPEEIISGHDYEDLQDPTTAAMIAEYVNERPIAISFEG